MWYGRGGKGEDLREVKTQERIGTYRQGKTGWLDARLLPRLNPLKTTSSFGVHAKTARLVRTGRRGSIPDAGPTSRGAGTPRGATGCGRGVNL
jgi:hypothetical protein